LGVNSGSLGEARPTFSVGTHRWGDVSDGAEMHLYIFANGMRLFPIFGRKSFQTLKIESLHEKGSRIYSQP
jgi:hypothetical protein